MGATQSTQSESVMRFSAVLGMQYVHMGPGPTLCVPGQLIPDIRLSPSFGFRTRRMAFCDASIALLEREFGLMQVIFASKIVKSEGKSEGESERENDNEKMRETQGDMERETARERARAWQRECVSDKGRETETKRGIQKAIESVRGALCPSRSIFMCLCLQWQSEPPSISQGKRQTNQISCLSKQVAAVTASSTLLRRGKKVAKDQNTNIKTLLPLRSL